MEGLGNKFLANIRETDAIVHVVRCFESDDVIHVDGKINPLADIDVINLELIFADMQMAENSIKKLEKQIKSNKDLQPCIDFLNKALSHLNKNSPIRTLNLNEDEKKLLKIYHFITAKKVIYAANISENDLSSLNSKPYLDVKNFAQAESSIVIPFCAKLEEELASLSENEALDFLDSLGLKGSGLDRIINVSYKMLSLITFLTSGEQETRAWTIKQGASAPEAAGKIHTDLQKGFIRAEVISYTDMVKYNGRVGARDAGKAKSEGKEYEVKDGDVILFFHSK